jgi:uncharacterized membrane protein YfcA
MSLPVVGVASLGGAAGHWRAGHVSLRTALVFGSVAMAGAFLGARLAAALTGTTQLLLLAVVMLAAAGAMLRGKGRESSDPSEPAAAAPAPMPVVMTMTVALGVGILTGLVGIGGGFLVVPALVLLGRQPMKRAIGTSLLVIAMNAAAGSLGYNGQVDIPWRFTALFTAAAIGGILVGTRLVRHVPAAALRRAFALFLVAVGALMLVQNVSALRLAPAATPRAH